METGTQQAGKRGSRELVIARDDFLQTQEQCLSMSKKSGKNVKGPVWMFKELLSLLKCEQETHSRWKHGWATLNEYRDIFRVHGTETLKVKAHLISNLA